MSENQQDLDKINALLEQNSPEWTTVWKSALLKTGKDTTTLLHLNNLLKIINTIVKLSQPEPVIQALGCWKHLIENLDQIASKEKCFNIILYPLTNTTNFIPNVVQAKFEVWEALVNEDYILHPTIARKAMEELLKFLHGSPRGAFWVSGERSGNIFKNVIKMIYNKMPTSRSVDNDLYKICSRIMLSSMKTIVIWLNKSDEQKTIAKEIWKIALDFNNKGVATEIYITGVLEKIQASPTGENGQLLCFMLNELIKNQENVANRIVNDNLKLISKCLALICGDESLSMLVEKVLKFAKGQETEFLEYTIETMMKGDPRMVEDYWAIVMKCYARHYMNIASDHKKIHDLLLIPLCRLKFQWNENVLLSWKECYTTFLTSDNNATNITDKLINDILKYMDSDTTVITTTSLSSICAISRIMLKNTNSDSTKGVGSILKKIHNKMSSPIIMRNLQYRNVLTYYKVILDMFVKTFEDQKAEMENCFKFVESQDKIMKMDLCAQDTKIVAQGVEPSTPNSKVVGGGGGRYSFMTRLSPGYKKNEEKENCKLQDENKEKNATDFVYVPAKPKTTPLTEHQMDRKKSYIPALYHDLSQDSNDAFSQVTQVVTKILKDEGANRRQSIQFQFQDDTDPVEHESMNDSIIKEQVGGEINKNEKKEEEGIRENGKKEEEEMKEKKKEETRKMENTTEKRNKSRKSINPIKFSEAEHPAELHKKVHQIVGGGVGESGGKSSSSSPTTKSKKNLNGTIENSSKRVSLLKRSPVNTRNRTSLEYGKVVFGKRKLYSQSESPSNSSSGSGGDNDNENGKPKKISKINETYTISQNNETTTTNRRSSRRKSNAEKLEKTGKVEKPEKLEKTTEKIEKTGKLEKLENSGKAERKKKGYSEILKNPSPELKDIGKLSECENLGKKKTDRKSRLIVTQVEVRQQSESELENSADFLTVDRKQNRISLAKEHLTQVLNGRNIPIRKSVIEKYPEKVKEAILLKENGKLVISKEILKEAFPSRKTIAGMEMQKIKDVQEDELMKNDEVKMNDEKEMEMTEVEVNGTNTKEVRETIIIEEGSTTDVKSVEPKKNKTTPPYSRTSQILQMAMGKGDDLTVTPILKLKSSRLSKLSAALLDETNKKDEMNFVKPCESPGILKRKMSFVSASPKSKLVNFPDPELTDMREYSIHNGRMLPPSAGTPTNDDHDYTDTEGSSQDLLFSPLKDCDKSVDDFLTNMCHETSIKEELKSMFEQIVIMTVGDLASLPLVMAKTIPVGDNRVRTLRELLTEYMLEHCKDYEYKPKIKKMRKYVKNKRRTETPPTPRCIQANRRWNVGNEFLADTDMNAPMDSQTEFVKCSENDVEEDVMIIELMELQEKSLTKENDAHSQDMFKVTDENEKMEDKVEEEDVLEQHSDNSQSIMNKLSPKAWTVNQKTLENNLQSTLDNIFSMDTEVVVDQENEFAVEDVGNTDIGLTNEIEDGEEQLDMEVELQMDDWEEELGVGPLETKENSKMDVLEKSAQEEKLEEEKRKENSIKIDGVTQSNEKGQHEGTSSHTPTTIVLSSPKIKSNCKISLTPLFKELPKTNEKITMDKSEVKKMDKVEVKEKESMEKGNEGNLKVCVKEMKKQDERIKETNNGIDGNEFREKMFKCLLEPFMPKDKVREILEDNSHKMDKLCMEMTFNYINAANELGSNNEAEMISTNLAKMWTRVESFSRKNNDNNDNS